MCASVILAGWQVNEGEDVVLNEAGETKENRIEEETHEAQVFVQCPFVQVDSQHLNRKGHEISPSAETQHFLLV